MHRVTPSLVFIIGFAGVVLGKLSPLTVKDLSLMLRTGYSAAAIEQEVALRHLIEPIDAAAEKALLQAGATSALLAKLKGGAYAVPAGEVAAAQQEIEAQAQRRARAEAEATKNNAQYQDSVARNRAAVAAAAVPFTNAVATMVKGDLVTSTNGTLSVYNDQPLEKKKLIGLYFSAYWCGPCRKFTPKLVEYYNRVAPAHPEFEIVFVSQDRAGSAMEKYMRDMQMPWPAVAYDKIKEKTALQQYAGSGIPCLVLLDAQGRVVSNSYDGKTYLGPEKVLADLDQIFAGGAPAAVAQTR